jgi:hypothetical protein
MSYSVEIPPFNGKRLEDGTLEQGEFYNLDGTLKTDCRDAKYMIKMIALEKKFDGVMKEWDLPELSLQSPTHKHLFKGLGLDRVKKMRKYIKNNETWTVPRRHDICVMIKKYVKRIEAEEQKRQEPDELKPELTAADASMVEIPKVDEVPKDAETPKVDEVTKVAEMMSVENGEKEKTQ